MPDDARLPALRPAPSLFLNRDEFEFGQRVAKMFAESQLIPKHLHGKVADCLIAYDMALRMGEDPIMVMQNIYIVNGRAGWQAQYMIARANRSGIFSGPLRWRVDGAGPSLSVTCFADLAQVDDGERRVEITVSMAMAKADGWTRNEKYVSIPEQMLRWRSATWLIRLYCPEVMMGLPAIDEIEDSALKDITPPRPELADFQGPRAETGESVSRETSRPRGRPRKPAEPEPTPANPPAETEPSSDNSTAAVFEFGDVVGEIHSFPEPAAAVAAYAEALDGAGDMKTLEALWENGAGLVHALREAGQDQSVELLHKQHDELAAALDAAPETGQPAETTAADPGDDQDAAAPAAEAPVQARGELYDVLVPLTQGMTAQGWFPKARAKLKKMAETDRCPPEDFRRFRAENAPALDMLKRDLGSWFSMVEKQLADGEQAKLV